MKQAQRKIKKSLSYDVGTWESTEQDWRQVDSGLQELSDFSDFARQ